MEDERYTTWLATIGDPIGWLSGVVWEWGFPPKKDPTAMTHTDIQKAVASVLLSPRRPSSQRCGVAVSCFQSDDWRHGLKDSCRVAFYSSVPITIGEAWEAFVVGDGIEMVEPAYGSLDGIERFLTRGDGVMVGRVLRKGQPIRSNG